MLFNAVKLSILTWDSMEISTVFEKEHFLDSNYFCLRKKMDTYNLKKRLECNSCKFSYIYTV